MSEDLLGDQIVAMGVLLSPTPDKPIRRRLATVSAISSGVPVTATISLNNASIPGVRMLASVSVSVSDVVWVDFNGSDPLIIGKMNNGQFGGEYVSPGIELYHSAGTPFIDFHAAANPAGDSNADYKSRFIMQTNGRFDFTVAGTYTFNMWGDGEFDCHHIGVNGDNTDNDGIHVNASSVIIRGTGGRNWFKDTELSSGTGLRVGAAWGYYGIYAENGDLVIGAASGQTRVQSAQYTFNGTGFQTWNYPIILSAVGNDTTHRVYHDTNGGDGVHILGYNAILGHLTVGACQITWDNSGQLFTNYGCGLAGDWALDSRYAGAGTGGCLKSKSGGNRLRFDWTASTFQFWVDVTNVKNFVIDHPLGGDKWLIHACLEAPEVLVMYRGESRLENGWVQVDLPPYFEALTNEDGRSVMLTAIADDPADEWCPVLHATYPKAGRFFVGLGSGVVVNDQRFWWQVTAVRKDVPPLLVEPSKDAVDVMGEGPYTYYREKVAS